jgi:hypothetical protein
MKKSILILSSFMFMTGVIITSCSSPAEKVANAQNDVKEASLDLAAAKEERRAEIEKFRKETAEKIAINEQNIADFKARKENEKQMAKDDYNKKINELEQKNSDMKKKMDDYQAEGAEQWEKFKTEFSHDMDELGKAFKDLTVTNVK